jgi:hypothetical protein
MQVLQEIKGYGEVKVNYGKGKEIKVERQTEFLEEQIRTKPPIEDGDNDEEIQ